MKQDDCQFAQWEAQHHMSEAQWDKFWRVRLTPALHAYRQRRPVVGQAGPVRLPLLDRNKEVRNG